MALDIICTISKLRLSTWQRTCYSGVCQLFSFSYDFGFTQHFSRLSLSLSSKKREEKKQEVTYTKQITLRAVYMCQIWWAIQVFWIKLSILCLYLRIFPSKRFRVYVFIVMGCILVALLILLPMDIWQCNPIHTSWTLDFKEAYCLSLTNVAYANAAINIATEVAILVLPLPMLHTLPIQSTSRKIGLYSLIGAGIL